MASIKQCKMLSARSKEAGMEYNFDDFKDLENGEVDDKIKEIEKFARDGETVGSKVKGSVAQQVANDQAEREKGSSKVPAERPKELNGFRFGMAYKIVRENWTGKEIEHQKDLFIKQIVNEYELTMEAEEAVTASSSPCKDCDRENTDFCINRCKVSQGAA